jgi:hypothetical protein
VIFTFHPIATLMFHRSPQWGASGARESDALVTDAVTAWTNDPRDLDQ